MIYIITRNDAGWQHGDNGEYVGVFESLDAIDKILGPDTSLPHMIRDGLKVIHAEHKVTYWYITPTSLNTVGFSYEDT